MHITSATRQVRVRWLMQTLNYMKKDNISKYEKYKKPDWFKRNRIEFWTIIGGLFAINFIFVSNAFRRTNTVDPASAGQLGDFVGGYIGTIFALISVVFLYSTLKDQRKSSTIEKFQNKYFELIRLHRDNVTEINIGKDSGKKIFVILIREFRAIHKIAKELSETLKLNYSKEELFKISYYALFFGVGPNSSRMLKEALKNYDNDFVEAFEKMLNDKTKKNAVRSERSFHFTPFEGHQSRLGHYFRHLYQTVCFVDECDLEIDKYAYVKTIRAQLTTHEQALLFINCLTPIGRVWWDKNLIVKYRFVQNIPFGFFDTGEEINLESYFPTDYFEWNEISVLTNNNEKTQPS